MSVAIDNVDHKQVYGEITKIYDLAEGIIDAIEAEGVKNPEQQIAIAESVIEQAGKSGDEMSEAYIDFAEGGYKSNTSDSNRIQTAVRKVFKSITEFDEKLDSLDSEEDGQNQITLEDLQAKMKIIQILGANLPESKIQRSLRRKAIKLGVKYGGLLVLAVKRLGDHVLGLMHVFQSLNLGEVINSIPNRSGWKIMGVIRDAQVAVPVLNRDGPRL